MAGKLWYAILFFSMLTLSLEAGEYFVATDGIDTNPGTKDKPFRTIQKASDIAGPGDTCYVKEGTYRETVELKKSGQSCKPIRFTSLPGEKVRLSGTEILKSKWKIHKGAIYKTTVQENFVQLFVDGEMMIEARWPNARFEQMLEQNTWAHASTGSFYGKMVDPNLAKTGIDWTGAVANLNVAHQFFSWTRIVKEHAKGSDTFTYEQDLGAGVTRPGLMKYPEKWEDDHYYLTGKLEALDVPTEWHLDRNNQTLYLWCSDNASPESHIVEVKVRDYGFEAENINHVELNGFDLFATTLRFEDCNNLLIQNCRIFFPVYFSELQKLRGKPDCPSITIIKGSNNTINHCHLAHSAEGGLVVHGSNNTVEDCLIHNICWNGSLRYTGLHIGCGEGNTARHNTLFDAGNAILAFRQGPVVLEYNHVYNGGRLCKDVALVYTGQPQTAGSIVRYNWVHGCRATHTTIHGVTVSGGLGIRGDDQTRNLTVHHNVVWNCGRDGIIIKGDNNRVYNNTVFDIGTKERPGNYVNLHTNQEPFKSWRKQYPLLKTQNPNSQI
ncbi:MAG: right-handed parallel beta-helix repeat-containing protein, partial [Planctomycetota bacterium]